MEKIMTETATPTTAPTTKLTMNLAAEMIALNENRSAMTLGDRGTEDGCRIFMRSLIGETNLPPGQLENNRPSLLLSHGLENTTRGMEGNRPHIEGWNGEAAIRFSGANGSI